MKQFNLFSITLLLIALAIPKEVWSQKQTKVSQSLKVDDDVTIDLNTSFCNIEFDSWNKDVVEIEAYVEGENLSKEELQAALESWIKDVI